MPRLLVATKNAHKTAEIRAMLGAAWDVTDLTAHPAVPAPEETGATFAENAAIKALAASQIFPGFVLADDSGLEVDALGGAPGVRSARYAGSGASDADNRARLRRELAAVAPRDPRRTARFRCALAVARAGRVLASFDGTVEGALLDDERGEGGFGYDALFVPDGYGETFAQLSGAVKNMLSHRARALESARTYLTESCRAAAAAGS
jgi:XTP/dITP diphosphohydrolase